MGSILLQVVEKLIRGLSMDNSRNMFALFEHNKVVDRAVESRVIVADVLAKFERLERYLILFPHCVFIFLFDFHNFVAFLVI